MDNNDKNLNLTPDDGSFSVDAILAEYEAERALFGGEKDDKKPGPEAPAAPAHRIVYDSREQTIGEAELISEEVSYDAGTISGVRPEEPEDERVFKSVVEIETKAAEDPFGQESYFEEPREPASPEETSDESEDFRDAADFPEGVDFTGEEAGDVGGEYAASADYGSGYAVEDDGKERPGFSERILGPIAGLMSESSRRREEKRRAERERQKAEAEKERPPEMRADRAAAFYAAQADSLKLRCVFASAVTLALLWLSLSLPAAGLLGRSPTIKAVVCLVLMLVVLVIGLDIFTTGILTLFRKKPGAETLIAVSCIVSAADAVVIAVTGDINVGLPFCGVSALSVVLALWGNYFACRGFALSFETAASTDNPSVVAALSGVDEEGGVLAKLKRPVTGFVRASESADIFESAYRIMAPIFIVGSIVLSLFVYFASEKCDNLIHTLAAGVAACASLSAVFGFAFPFYIMTKRLAKSGVAIAGYSGAADLGRIRRVLVTDTDIFPVRTLSIADISMAEGVRPGIVISYTGSMIAAAGLGLAPVFTELMRKNACSIQKVEDFACHEGGGLVARINGDQVYVGTSAFMQLMGVRLPKGASSKSAVYTAVNDALSGIFAINYKPVATVQRALVSLLRGKTEPLFAVRDFNITPLLVKQKFRLPLESYNFPSFADRYRISSPVSGEAGTVAAMFTRGGLNSVAGLAARGRKLYNRARVSLVLSLAGTLVGLVMMLALCWSGSFDSASCGNLIAYMVLWLVPTFVMSLGLRN